MERTETTRDAWADRSPVNDAFWGATPWEERGRGMGARKTVGADARLADPFADALGMLPATVLADHASLPDRLSKVLADLNGRVTSVDVCRSLVSCLPQAPPYLAAALVDVAAAADGSGCGNSYHNPVHSRDVGVIFANLMRLQAMLETGSPVPDAVEFLTGCCAAFGHDIGHDGGDGGPEPFRLERQAADTVGAIMDHHTADLHLIERIYCAILATDVHNGYRALDEAARGFISNDIPKCLHGLEGRKSREIASLLRDADVMQSAGLTPEDHDRQTARLEQERGIPRNSMGVRGADFFLKDLIQGRFLSKAGHLFQPRLDRLLQLNELRARDGQASCGLADVDRS